jgi:phosphoglycolate phosphatase-like HAD superfamily hydrolase
MTAEVRYRARGPRPTFFADTQLDRFHVMLVALLQEVSVVRDRLDTVERLLDQRGVLTRADIEAYLPDTDAEAERSEERSALIERVLRVVFEEAAAQKESNQNYEKVEDVVAAVSNLEGQGLI